MSLNPRMLRCCRVVRRWAGCRCRRGLDPKTLAARLRGKDAGASDVGVSERLLLIAWDVRFLRKMSADAMGAEAEVGAGIEVGGGGSGEVGGVERGGGEGGR